MFKPIRNFAGEILESASIRVCPGARRRGRGGGCRLELDAAVKTIDFGKLDSGDQAGFDASLQRAQEKLKTLNPWLKNFTVRAAGNSHIDMAWLWPWTETVEVVRNTFRSVLDLMR